MKKLLLAPVCSLLALSLVIGWSDNAKARIEVAKDEAPKAQTKEVIAEGVGATADEALKNAYRNAVRQVVGAVVDTTTLVKNDEVIDDKVLTYSDGFIKKYEEIPGSKKVQGGLHKIKIKAQVELRSVVAKLKAANVTVKEVDGKSLFGEIVTQIDAEKAAGALLLNQFEGFPQSCITATAVGMPEILEKSANGAKVKIDFQVMTDLKAYKTFSSRLVPILEKMAKAKGEFTAEFKKVSKSESSFGNQNRKNYGNYMEALIGESDGYPRHALRTGIPHAFEKIKGEVFPCWKDKTLTLVVATGRTQKGDSSDYRYFILDYALLPDLVKVASRAGKVKVQLLNEGGEVIVTKAFPILSTISAFGIGQSNYGIVRLNLSIQRDQPESDPGYEEEAKRARLFLVNNVFGGNTPELGGKLTADWGHYPMLLESVVLSLGLDDLKSIKDVKVEVQFEERLPIDKD